MKNTKTELMHAVVLVGVLLKKKEHKKTSCKQYFVLPQQKEEFFQAIGAFPEGEEIDPFDLVVLRGNEFKYHLMEVNADYREIERLSKDLYCSVSLQELEEQVEMFVENECD